MQTFLPDGLTKLVSHNIKLTRQAKNVELNPYLTEAEHKSLYKMMVDNDINHTITKDAHLLGTQVILRVRKCVFIISGDNVTFNYNHPMHNGTVVPYSLQLHWDGMTATWV